MFRISAIAAASALAVGCASVEESDFATELAVVECRTLKKCALGQFESDYDGKMNDCVDDRGDLLDDFVEITSDICEYDVDQATQCVRRVDGMSCEDWAEGDGARACDLVYDCSEPSDPKPEPTAGTES